MRRTDCSAKVSVASLYLYSENGSVCFIYFDVYTEQRGSWQVAGEEVFSKVVYITKLEYEKLVKSTKFGNVNRFLSKAGIRGRW